MRMGIARVLGLGLLVGVLLGLVVAVLTVDSVRAAVPPNRAELAGRVIELTNVERARQGLPVLAYDQRLKRAAQKYAKLMVATDCFGHSCGDVGLAQRIAVQGYPSTSRGENIHPGPTPDAAIGWWMSSAVHRANILRRQYVAIGVGVAAIPDPAGQHLIYVQVFAS